MIYVSARECSYLYKPEKDAWTLELKLWEAVIVLTWVLGTKPGYSAGQWELLITELYLQSPEYVYNLNEEKLKPLLKR